MEPFAVRAGPVVVLGDVMEDIIVFPQGDIAPGSDVRAEIKSRPGGSGANQAMWLAHQAVPVRFLGQVAASDRSRLTKQFERAGIEAHLIGDGNAETGRLVTLVSPDGERSFFTDRGANLGLSASSISTGFLERAALVVLSGYSFFESAPREAAQTLMALARQHKIPVCIDPSSEAFLREAGTEQFFDWIKGADWLVPNMAEARFLSGAVEAEDQLSALACHVPNILLKRGAEGGVAGDASGTLANVEAVDAKVVDTTGAGDAFLAGFIAARQKGGSIKDALVRANRAGAAAASQPGGQP